MIHTRLCDLVGIEYPIVQTGMGWVAGARLTSATSAAGGLGILASATMTFDQLADAVHEVQGRTDRPFGVNLRADQDDIDRRVDLLIRERVRVASFAQAPGEQLVKRLRDGGVVTMPTVGAPRHAEKVAAWGVDALIAQGAEGGGHTGNIPTSLLLPAVVDVVTGIGYNRAAELGPDAARFHRIPRVVSNLGVFDFETPARTMRLRSVHPGVTVDEVVAATGFELEIPHDVPESRAPTAEELVLIRDVLDPNDLRSKEVAA